MKRDFCASSSPGMGKALRKACLPECPRGSPGDFQTRPYTNPDNASVSGNVDTPSATAPRNRAPGAPSTT